MEAQARDAQERKTMALEDQQSQLKTEMSDLYGLVAAFRATEAKYASNPAALAKPGPGETGAAAKDSKDEPDAGFFGKGMSGMLAKMMKDPAMKDLMRAQQKVMMSSMYGGLAKELNLAPEQNDKLMALLLDQQMKNVDRAQTLFAKDGDTGATNLWTAIGDEQKQSEESIKALLGEEQFAQYQDYTKTLGERMQINMFQQQMEGGQSALQDEQLKQLMAVIREERDNNPPAMSSDLKPDAANFEKIFSGDLLEKQMQWQKEQNQRVLERAGQILTPEQLKAYGDFQNQQLNMQKLGMKMAREMFGNKPGAGEVKVQEAPAR